jgi:hypothetical protein
MLTQRTIRIKRKSTPDHSYWTGAPPSSLPVPRGSILYPGHAQPQSGRPLKSYGETVKPKFRSTLNDPKFISMREQFQNDHDLNEIDDRELVLFCVHLREFTQQCASLRHLEEAEAATALLQEARDELAFRRTPQEPVNTRLPRAEEGCEYARRKKERDLDELAQKMGDRREKYVQRQAVQEDAFEEKWVEEGPLRHRKSSTKLLQMKQIEKCMILTEDFAGARELEKEIEEREKMEAVIQQERLDLDYTQSRVNFETRQASCLGFFEARVRERRAETVVKADREVKVAEASLNVAKNHEPMISRKPMSSNTSRSVAYGTSFAHVAKDNRFELQPVLPSIRAPEDARGRKRPKTKIQPIIQQIPRLYVFQNESPFVDLKQGFPTALVPGRSEDEPGEFSSESWTLDLQAALDEQNDYAVSRGAGQHGKHSSDSDEGGPKPAGGESDTEMRIEEADPGSGRGSASGENASRSRIIDDPVEATVVSVGGSTTTAEIPAQIAGEEVDANEDGQKEAQEVGQPGAELMDKEEDHGQIHFASGDECKSEPASDENEWDAQDEKSARGMTPKISDVNGPPIADNEAPFAGGPKSDGALPDAPVEAPLEVTEQKDRDHTALPDVIEAFVLEPEPIPEKSDEVAGLVEPEVLRPGEEEVLVDDVANLGSELVPSLLPEANPDPPTETIDFHLPEVIETIVLDNVLSNGPGADVSGNPDKIDEVAGDVEPEALKPGEEGIRDEETGNATIEAIERVPSLHADVDADPPIDEAQLVNAPPAEGVNDAVSVFDENVAAPVDEAPALETEAISTPSPDVIETIVLDNALGSGPTPEVSGNPGEVSEIPVAAEPEALKPGEEGILGEKMGSATVERETSLLAETNADVPMAPSAGEANDAVIAAVDETPPPETEVLIARLPDVINDVVGNGAVADTTIPEESAKEAEAGPRLSQEGVESDHPAGDQTVVLSAAAVDPCVTAQPPDNSESTVRAVAPATETIPDRIPPGSSALVETPSTERARLEREDSATDEPPAVIEPAASEEPSLLSMLYDGSLGAIVENFIQRANEDATAASLPEAPVGSVEEQAILPPLAIDDYAAANERALVENLTQPPDQEPAVPSVPDAPVESVDRQPEQDVPTPAEPGQQTVSNDK